MKRIDANFTSKGLKCAAWLYLPESEVKPPVVVMAHGFAAERSFSLPAFAERFAEKGLAVLVFDYRNFGDSEGEPRNLVSPKRHLEDWEAAIAHARSLDAVDGTRLGLWGTSFSGGHVLVSAARDGRVQAVVSQVPFVDGFSTAVMMSARYLVAGMFHGLLDLGSLITGQSPHYVPVVESPDRFGLMNTPESKPGYLALLPEGSNWQNRAPARIALTISNYRPLASAAKINCPVFLVYAENDSLISARAVEKCAKRIKQVETMKLPIGHFEVYHGEWFEKAVAAEANFFTKKLYAA